MKRAAIIILMILCMVAGACAEERECYIICQPTGLVNAHSSPKLKAPEVGWLILGKKLVTDGRMKNGFVYVTGICGESEDGWVSAKYVTYEEPLSIDVQATVKSKGRVAARRGINGKRIAWLKPGSEVTLLVWTEDWCVTDRGFVMTKYLEID